MTNPKLGNVSVDAVFMGARLGFEEFVQLVDYEALEKGPQTVNSLTFVHIPTEPDRNNLITPDEKISLTPEIP